MSVVLRKSLLVTSIAETSRGRCSSMGDAKRGSWQATKLDNNQPTQKEAVVTHRIGQPTSEPETFVQSVLLRSKIMPNTSKSQRSILGVILKWYGLKPARTQTYCTG